MRKERDMDATRPRRTQDAARQRWYALCRAMRFARHLQFPVPLTDTPPFPEPSQNAADGLPLAGELTISIHLNRCE